MKAGYIPYCGNAPTPGWATWNLDPNLLTVLLAALLIYAAVFSREPTMSRRQALCLGAGWLVLALALISPLCNLSVALFSVRVGQHMIIALIAAPLLVAGGVDLMMEHAALGRLSPPGHREVVLATLAFAGAVWFWHLPAPYDATFHSDITYWTMHVTMLAAALALWRVILRSPPRSDASVEPYNRHADVWSRSHHRTDIDGALSRAPYDDLAVGAQPAAGPEPRRANHVGSGGAHSHTRGLGGARCCLSRTPGSLRTRALYLSVSR